VAVGAISLRPRSVSVSLNWREEAEVWQQSAFSAEASFSKGFFALFARTLESSGLRVEANLVRRW